MRRPEYKASPAELRRLLEAGEGYASIGRMHGVDEGVVRYRCRELGLTQRRNGKRPEEHALRMALRHSDIPLTRIALAFGVEPRTIWAAARDYGLPTDEPGRRALLEAYP